MSDAYHTLHLIGVHPDKRALAIRAVRALLDSAGMGDTEGWDTATQAVYRVLRGEGPVGLVRDLEATVTAARAAFTKSLGGNYDAATLAYDLDTSGSQAAPEPEAGKPETGAMTITLGGPIQFRASGESGPPVEGEGWTRQRIEHEFISPTPPDFDPSYQAARTALVLMAAMDGKAANAWYYAKALGCSTEDVELWVEVGNLIAESFGFEKGGAS